MENPMDPLSMIKSDHDKVRTMFEDYEGMSYEKKAAQAEKICRELAVHMEMEENIFYPKLAGLSEAGREKAEHGIDEHEEAKSHIYPIYKAEEETELDEHMREMKGTVIGHMEEEENEVFPMAEGFRDDFKKLAAEMGVFKAKAKGEKLLEELRKKI